MVNASDKEPVLALVITMVNDPAAIAATEIRYVPAVAAPLAIATTGISYAEIALFVTIKATSAAAAKAALLVTICPTDALIVTPVDLLVAWVTELGAVAAEPVL